MITYIIYNLVQDVVFAFVINLFDERLKHILRKRNIPSVTSGNIE